MLLVLLPLLTLGQINPKAGYVITNENDTVKGIIDYREDAENCQQCLFKEADKDEFQSYKPGDIKGYRLADNGVYFVTRKFQIEGVDIHVFAEYLLKGGVSLYRYTDREDHYFIVNENAATMVLTDDQLARNDEDIVVKTRRRGKLMANAPKVFDKDIDMVKQLLKVPYSAEALTPLVRKYNETYCKESGECVQYQYDAKRSKRINTRINIGAGYVNTSDFKGTYYCKVAKLSFGCEFSSARKVAPAFSKEVGVSVDYDYGRQLDDDNSLFETGHLNFMLNAGVVYRFTPMLANTYFVKGGVPVSTNFMGIGLYVGFGREWMVSRHNVQLLAKCDFLQGYIRSKGCILVLGVEMHVAL